MAVTAPDPEKGSSKLAWRTGLLLLAAANAGCNSCEHDRPYTPFRVDAAATSAPSAVSQLPAASSAPGIPDPPAVVTLESREVEPPSGRFTVGTREIELANPWQAVRVLELASKDGGQPNALVWVTPANPDPNWNGPLGELRFFPFEGEPKTVFELPAFVPTGPGCVREVRLRQLSPATVLVDVQARCERSLPQRTPNRAIALLGLKPSPNILLGLRVAEPAVDELVNVSAASADRDGDGREDPSIRFELEVVTSHAKASASLGWLDRTAGLSLDGGYLSTTLEPVFSSWEQNLKRRSEIPNVQAQTAALRRLLASLCQQSTVPRVFDWRGEPLRCSAIQQVGVKLARIEVAAGLGQADPLEAARAVQYATTWLGGLPKSEPEALLRRVSKTLKAVQAELVPNQIRAIPKAADGSARYSPLRFTADGSLLIQGEGAKLMRIDSTGATTILDADSGVEAWPLSVTAADGRRWFGVVPSCDRSELALALNGPDGSLLPLVPTRLLSPRPGVCKNPTAWPFSVAPIAWQDASPTALIDGACWSGSSAEPCPVPSKLGPVVPGSPRSPDGHRLIASTLLGAIVLGGTKPELWAGASTNGKPHTDCAVANEARAIACLDEQNQLVLLRRSEVEPKKK